MHVLLWIIGPVLAMTARAEDIVLADFSDEAAASSWAIVNDTGRGGRSSSQFRIEDGALQFSGTLNTNGGGFASVRGTPMRTGVSGHNLIRLMVRGDGRTYQLRLASAATATTYRATFGTEPQQWLEVELPLEDFRATWRGRVLDRPPIQAQDVGGLGLLLADGKDGPFSVAIRWVTIGDAGN